MYLFPMGISLTSAMNVVPVHIIRVNFDFYLHIRVWSWLVYCTWVCIWL